ncbi:hypothetical protein Pmani_008226 [Petrolisthes manimaculis]|uniref:Uncharacterized protein n=1 Tax=Petrolisthes manimaculis TaxID=1843537 RepID=A0AAE1UE38_9EUCA|nr:hypothetical protein Pmani_008226 [Petrolisthes manimaculis]
MDLRYVLCNHDRIKKKRCWREERIDCANITFHIEHLAGSWEGDGRLGWEVERKGREGKMIADGKSGGKEGWSESGGKGLDGRQGKWREGMGWQTGKVEGRDGMADRESGGKGWDGRQGEWREGMGWQTGRVEGRDGMADRDK